MLKRKVRSCTVPKVYVFFAKTEAGIKIMKALVAKARRE
jgi:hypothetical protein